MLIELFMFLVKLYTIYYLKSYMCIILRQSENYKKSKASQKLIRQFHKPPSSRQSFPQVVVLLAIKKSSSTTVAVFSSSKNTLCKKKKILRYIKLAIHAWSTKYR
jgi:hypothetical protein